MLSRLIVNFVLSLSQDFSYLDQADQLHEPPSEQADLLLDMGDVLLVDLLQGLKSVARVGA
jgi:hypothetical protein